MTTTPDTQTPKIFLDGKTYEIDLLSDEAKSICGELQANENLIAHHSASLSQFPSLGALLRTSSSGFWLMFHTKWLNLLSELYDLTTRNIPRSPVRSIEKPRRFVAEPHECNELLLCFSTLASILVVTTQSLSAIS